MLGGGAIRRLYGYDEHEKESRDTDEDQWNPHFRRNKLSLEMLKVESCQQVRSQDFMWSKRYSGVMLTFHLISSPHQLVKNFEASPFEMDVKFLMGAVIFRSL